MKRVAGVLAGCGFLDGAEIQEAVLTQLALEQRGVALDWFAPDRPQHHVVDHVQGRPLAGETRNVLAESARIARGRVRPLASLDLSQFGGLVMPGGYGAAKNLCDFAFAGAGMSVLPELAALVLAARRADLALGFLCIAPVIAAQVLGQAGHRPRVTIGSDTATAAAIRSWGAEHVDCTAVEICVDEANRLVSTPAWNAAASIVEVAEGVQALAGRLVDWL